MAKIIKIPSAYVMDTKVVGVSKSNSDGSDRQEIIKQHVEEGDKLKLKMEPTNAFDPNAIKVLTDDGLQIGYLSMDISERIKFAILNEAQIMVKASWVSGEKMLGVGLRIELVN